MTASTTPGQTLRVVIVDDHPTVLDALERRLATHGAEVVATVGDGESALEVVARERPDVAILDLRHPGPSGIEILVELAARAPGTRLLVHTGAIDPSQKLQALAAGAAGVIEKGASLDEVVRAVNMVASGDRYVDGRLANHMLENPRTTSPLTEREIVVLRHLADGDSNNVIAAQLHIAPSTVRAHLRNAMRKLGSHTRTQAVATALRRSLFS